MKKTARYTLPAMMLALALYACQERHPQQPLPDLPFTSPLLSPALLTLATDSQMARDRKAEMDYYLERHNVEDEGYEMVAAFANGQRHRVELDTIPIYNVGRWKGKKREGTAISRDSLGRITIGHWDADTLVSGLRIDSAGTYQGAFAHGRAEGHGSYLAADGHYYEGHWRDDRQEGFGIQLLENEVVTILKTGEWQQGVFKGERMNYTSERIYGIDISRYQHGKGRKKHPILWNRLRISHLGRKSKKQISGVVDYPVSFCFIKSTESTRIRNPYFAQDYNAARKAGIPVGAYHFFSTRQTGAAQAQFFIAHTQFRKGDLPPVLDIEPTDGRIAGMGGSQALWRNIRAWLQAVEKRCGVKPILYLNQKFINKYLPDAPDIARDYKIWIARYGEYKPGVKLVVWQLSPDGRVRGITGDVDINVFNGYRQQFDDFLEKETIK